LPAKPQSEGEFITRVEELERGGEVDDETLSRAAVGFIDNRAGIFGRIDEDADQQLPLRVTRVTVSDPTGALDPSDPLPVVFGAAPAFDRARCRAVRRAIELYASAAIDPRRLVGPGRGVWGLRLPEQAPVLVPSSQVFKPLDRAPRQWPPPGAASGHSWRTAVMRGLLRVWESQTPTQVTRGERICPRVPREALAEDPLAGHYLTLLDLLGADIAVYDLTGPPGIPTFAFCAGAKTVAYASGLSAMEAFRR